MLITPVSLLGLGLFPPSRGEQPREGSCPCSGLWCGVVWWNRRDSIAWEMPQRLEAQGLTQAHVTHLSTGIPMEAVQSSCG